MIDTVKRKTLKQLGLSAAAAATAAISGNAVAFSPDKQSTTAASTAEPLPLADIHVNTRVSSVTNDIEVLMTNAGAKTTRITQITPSETSTARGRFNFHELLSDGELTLAPGQSVTVPIKPHTVALDASTTAGEGTRSLHAALKRSFSVITENDSYARVRIGDAVHYG